MKKIPLNKGTLDLPDTWDDLTYRQKLFAFGRLKDVFEGHLFPAVFRLEILANITGYNPKTDIFSWIFKSFIYYMIVPFVSVYFYLHLGCIRFSGYWSIWSSYNKPKRNNRDVINYNLYRLSEQIDFAFIIQNQTIGWKRSFAKNPIPYIKIGGRKFTGRKFILGVAPFTNITGKEFSDCFDLYIAYIETPEAEIKIQLVDKLISILYPASSNYNENLVSEHLDLIKKLDPAIKFGILYWFSGIVEYYMNHPYYSILFLSNSTESNDNKISLGMNEIVLMIKKKGYDPEDNLNDFFDSQIKILKDDLSEAVSKGAKIEELATKTGISITNLNRLL